jgi:hypothetical protein
MRLEIKCGLTLKAIPTVCNGVESYQVAIASLDTQAEEINTGTTLTGGVSVQLKAKTIPKASEALVSLVLQQAVIELEALPTLSTDLASSVALFCKPRDGATEPEKRDTANYVGTLIANYATLRLYYPDPDRLLEAIDTAKTGMLNIRLTH